MLSFLFLFFFFFFFLSKGTTVFCKLEFKQQEKKPSGTQGRVASVLRLENLAENLSCSWVKLNHSLYTGVVLFFFSFFSVNKSPVVYVLSPALDGLSRENRRSVDRLT